MCEQKIECSQWYWAKKPNKFITGRVYELVAGRVENDLVARIVIAIRAQWLYQESVDKTLVYEDVKKN